MTNKTQKSLLIITLVGLLVYFNSLFNGFVWDDEEQILTNRLVHSITNLPAFFQGSTFNTGGSGSLGGLYYKPMMTVFFSLLYTIFGASAFIFHLFQISLHILNSIFVYLIFSHFLKPKGAKAVSLEEYIPLAGALIFLVHPINTEAVVYISSLQDILFFLFGAWALWMVLTLEKFSFVNIFKISLLILLSILSKETGIIFPAIILIYLLLYKKYLVSRYLFSATLAIGVYSILRFAIAGIYLNKHGLSPITTVPFLERIANIPQIIIFYLRTFIFPKNLITSQQWVIKSFNVSDFFIPLTLSIISIVSLIWLGLKIRNIDQTSFKQYLFFFFWFVLSLGLHLQIFPLDMTVAERWFYMPMVGLLGIMGVVVKKFKIQNLQFKIIVLGVTVLIISLLSLRTFVRNFDWKDGLTLYSHDIQLSKESFDLENNLGVELFRIKKFTEAKTHYENSTRLAPQWWTNWNNLAVIFEMEGDKEKAKEYYQKAITNGEYYLAYENLAKLLTFNEDAEISKPFIKESLEKLPLNSNLWLFLAISEYKSKNINDAKTAAYNSYMLSPSQENFYIYNRLDQNLPLEFKVSY